MGSIVKIISTKIEDFVISTVEMDEYSNQVDGIIQPDIHIPYIADEYMKGGDPVLEHCLDYIKTKQPISQK